MKIYDAIGIIAYPPILDIFVTLVFAFFSPFGLGMLTPFRVVAISLLFVTIIPFAPFPYFYRRGYVDFNVSDRKKRTIFYVVAIISYLAGASIFLYFGTMIMFYLVLSFAIIALVVMMVNFSWKISTHSASIAGPVTAIAYVFGWQYLVLHAFTAIVMFSRLKLKVHTLEQVVAGAAVSTVITFLVFYAFTPF